MVLTIKFTGLNALKKSVKNAVNRERDALGAALYQVGLEIDADAVQRTPVDTGRLRATHYVAPPRGGDLIVEAGFGTDYAEPVHELVENQHTVGEAKFLEKAVQMISAGFANNVARKAKRNFERGVSFKSIAATAPRTPSTGGGGGGV